MKKYFLYLLKQNLLPLACLTLVCVIVYVVPISAEDYYSWNTNHFDYQPLHITLYEENISMALGIMSILIPIYLFSYKMNKRSVDMHYSLPINKTKILIAHFLVGLIMLYASYSIAYLWGFITVAIKIERLYLINYLYLYLSSLIPAFILYAVTAFIYTRANTIIDGIISVVGALFLLTMTVVMLDVLWTLKWIRHSDFNPYVSLVQVTETFGNALRNGKIRNWFLRDFFITDPYVIIFNLISDVLWLLIAIASMVGLILTEKHLKAENCGQISESIFCFKVLIPAYTLMIVATIMADSQDITLLCAVAVGAYVLSVIYKRTFKIGWKYAVILVACIGGGILLSLIDM